MIAVDSPAAARGPENRSSASLIIFLLVALLLPVSLLVYHFGLWSSEQFAIAVGGLGLLEWAGSIGLLAQAVFLTGLMLALWRLTTDIRFKPVYGGWTIAALMAFPGLVLRLLGPNNDQLGSILQILICGIAAVIVSRLWSHNIRWQSSHVTFAFLLAAFGVGPLALFGAFGSLTDSMLSLFAGLSFGWLAALLIESTRENRFLDALGIGALLSLLGSAIGYDGAQLFLLAILPSFAFAVAALLPSRISIGIITGLLAAASLTFFDPSELSIVLGDMIGVAFRAVVFTVGLGLAVGLIALLIRSLMQSGSRWVRIAGVLGALTAWIFVAILFFENGNQGFYGDRLFVILKDQADLSNIRRIEDIDERRTAAYQTLTQHANETQADLRNTFDEFGVEYTPYYLVNAVEVRGGTLVHLYLASRPEVDRVIPSPRLRPVSSDESLAVMTGADPAPTGVQWNVSMTGADRVWEEFGVRGEGIVIGQSDSGADVNHPALKETYRGNTSGDDYNWFDPWNGKPSPYDDGGHGTHTLGTIVG
ncbi:MAG: S8 family serine peptidase, partial [Chloroflexota bacterium]|nr:S8 family serine peptidase [Chloroflexota bacterium]